MDKRAFDLLSTIDQLIILKTEAEELITIPMHGKRIVTLYSCFGYLIEEYRDRDSSELLKIEVLSKENEADHLQIYGLYVGMNDNTLMFSRKEKMHPIVICVNCNYERPVEGSTRMVEMPNCPICGVNHFKIKAPS